MADGSQLQRFEYDAFDTFRDVSPLELKEELNRRATAGWRMVAITPQGIVVMERPIPDR